MESQADRWSSSPDPEAFETEDQESHGEAKAEVVGQVPVDQVQTLGHIKT